MPTPPSRSQQPPRIPRWPTAVSTVEEVAAVLDALPWHSRRTGPGGPQAWHAPLPGNLLALRLAASLRCSALDVAALLLDAERARQLSGHVREAETLSGSLTDGEICYRRLAAGWLPLRDRDLVVRVQVAGGGGALRIASVGVADARRPPRPNAIRLPMFAALILLQPTADAACALELSVVVDPGGHLPAVVLRYVTGWLARDCLRRIEQQAAVPAASTLRANLAKCAAGGLTASAPART